MGMMRRLLAKLDLNLVTVVLIALIAALPLITRPGLPRQTDLELHVFRAAEFQRLLAERPLEYPRWAPNFYYGYGYPIFNYYAPLTYYAASVFARLPGMDIVGGMKSVLVLGFVLAACGAYIFARRQFGPTPGVVGAAAYVLSPYILFVDPFMRGDAAEFLALCLLPWMFAAFDRPLDTPRAVGRAALALALVVFSHNVLGLIAAGMLAEWLAWRGLFVDGARRWTRDGLAVGFAAGLTAVFWLPFFAERGAVRLDVAGPGHFDFRNHFVEPGTLLWPSPALDLGATSPHFIYNLGLAQWLLALTALFAVRRLPKPASRGAIFFVSLSLSLVFLITPVSRLVWEAVPSAALIQFPWRFLGPAAFALATCAAAGISAICSTGRRIGRLSGAVALMAVFAFALPTMYPPTWSGGFGDTSPRGSLEFELSGVALGTTSTDDFLPVSVARTPPPAQAVIDSIRVGYADRFDYTSASGGRVRPVLLGDLDAEYVLEAGDSFLARFLVFAFPGWQAYVDGQPIPVGVGGGDGFIQFDVPAQARSFGIRFESTPPRTIGAGVTLASGVALIVWMAVSPRRSPAETPAHPPVGQPSRQLAGRLLLIALAFGATKIMLIDRCDSCLRYTSPPGQALAATHPQEARFGSNIALLGFDLPRREVRSGESIPLTLYWRATAPVQVNYQVFAHLTRPAFILWGQSDKLNPGDFPSARWPLDKYVWDDHAIRVLPGTPPGEYYIVVGLYTLGDGRRAAVTDATGAAIGDSVQLSLPVRVVPAAQPPSIEVLDLQVRLDRREADLVLLGASIEQAVLPRPAFARVTLFWQASVDAPPDRVVRVRLIDARGEPASEIVSSPTGGAYPPPSWQAGEVVRDVYAFWLPPDFAPGVYRVQVNAQEGEPAIELGTIEVTE